MKKFTLGLLLLLAFQALISQPSPNDGGLTIISISIKDQNYTFEEGKWVNKNNISGEHDPPLQVSHYLLNKNLKPGRQPLPRFDPNDYKLGGNLPHRYAIFLPGRIDKKAAHHHRLVLSIGTDTMTVDFPNLPEYSFHYHPMIREIQFKPGKYVFDFFGRAEIVSTDQKKQKWVNYYRYQGINAESEPWLLESGILSYSPARNLKEARKYVTPRIFVDQTSPYAVSIRLQGNFLGRVMEEYITDKLVEVYLKVEYLQNAQWQEKVFGPGLDWSKDQDQLGLRYFWNGLILQLSTLPKSVPDNFKPGSYRITLLTEDKKELVSQPFVLGMTDPNPVNPYQTLYREGLGFPSYTQDYSHNISIQTPFNPQVKDSVNTYSFTFFIGKGRRDPYFPENPDQELFNEFITAATQKRLNINGSPFTGRVRYAFSEYVFRVSDPGSQINLYKVDYVEGKPVKHELLQDVDPIHEIQRVREN